MKRLDRTTPRGFFRPRFRPELGTLLVHSLGACLVAAGCGPDPGSGSAVGSARQPLPAPERMGPGEKASAFTLTGTDGIPFDSSSLAGKVWIASVFFANCPGPCFRENQSIAAILREIDDPSLMAVSLTCDPENDTPEALGRYAARFEADPARWKFLTGDMAVIKEIANKTFLLPAEVGVHSERGAIFDRQGRLRGSFHLLQEDRVEAMKKMLREVLAEESPRPAGERAEPAEGKGGAS